MRRLRLFAAAAALAFAVPATSFAQTVYSTWDTSGGMTASLVAQNDAAQIAIAGKDWATARVAVATAGSGGITFQLSLDGGVNWLTSAYAKRLDAAAANPSVAPWVNNSPVAGVFEVPLPANATHFRVLYQTAGTATTLTVSGGTRYTPGMLVTGTLYDVTSAVNTPLDTGILDLSGWAGFSVTYVTPAGGSGAVKGVDDAGSNVGVVTVPASATSTGLFSPSGATGTAFPAAGVASFAWREKRAQLTSAAVAALTSRIRIALWR